MIDVFIVFADLPCSIRGFTKKCIDGYTVVLNARMSREQNIKTYDHEIDHIKNGHLDKELNIQEIEYIAHTL